MKPPTLPADGRPAGPSGGPPAEARVGMPEARPAPGAATAWWPLSTSAALRPGRLLARTLLGRPLVLFRDAAGAAAALPDRCPHRHAPLSAGRVVDGELACGYHGWRFDAAGHCTRVPGRPSDCRSAQPLLRPVAVQQCDGLVWACLAPPATDAGPVRATGHAEPADVFFMAGPVAGSLADAAENFLDAFHTPFLHPGRVRRDDRRQPVEVQRRRLADGVEARYRGEQRPSGWISRWLEPARGDSLGRFRLPGLAEIEYHGPVGGRGPALRISVWFTPESAQQLRLHARIATPPGRLPAALKAAVLRRLFAPVMAQDQAMLARVQANRQRWRTTSPLAGPADPAESTATPDHGLDGPLDLLGPAIRALLAGAAVPAFGDETLEVRL